MTNSATTAAKEERDGGINLSNTLRRPRTPVDRGPAYTAADGEFRRTSLSFSYESDPDVDYDRDSGRPDSESSDPSSEASSSSGKMSQERPRTAAGSHTIETFFGNSTSFAAVYQSICDYGVNERASKGPGKQNLVTPESIRKLVLVGHPVSSFQGINKFTRLVEVCISSCKIKEAKWSDFEDLRYMHKMYLYNCGLQTIEPLQFPALKTLCVTDNKLSSLSFLGQGIPTLHELNAARNEITCLHEEQFQNCVNLHTLNLSGNPLCTVQDVNALKVLPALKTLYLADPVYGKCPVAALCDSRTMLLTILTSLTNLDGRLLTITEMTSIQNYVFTRSLFYFANAVKNDSEQVAKKKAVMSQAHKKLEKDGYRILQLIALDSRFKRTLSAVEILPVFANAKSIMRDHIGRIQERINSLTEHSKLSVRRLEVVMLVSRWEQETEKWLKWIEFQTYGNIQCSLIYTVHGSSAISTPDPVQLRTTIHRLISSLSCAGLWPHSTLVKVESVFVVRDKGMDIGIQRTFEAHYQASVEPPYIPPPALLDDIEKPIPPNTATFPFYTFPAYQSHRDIPTYTSTGYEPPKPLHPFPDSVTGLPEKPQTLFMYLVCPQNSSASANPLVFLQKLMTEKTKNYKDIRVTNCLWLASPQRGQKFSVVVVVKVLAESLQAVSFEKGGANHAWDCACFSLKHPHSISPAYIINISFTLQDKMGLKLKLPASDDDILITAESELSSLCTKLTSRDTALALGMYTPSSLNKKSTYCLSKTGNGLHADLSTMHVTFSVDEFASSSSHIIRPPKDKDSFMASNGFETNLAKYVGVGVEQFLTSLNLSGNKIGLTVGLKGLRSLKSLNLSHNNLTTLSGLERLPSLIELKIGWNSLRFLLSNARALSLATPRLLTLEILPNPFQDLRDISHLPALIRRILPFVNRVDLWTVPFVVKSDLAAWSPPPVAEAGFAHIAMAKSWDGAVYSYNDLAGQSLSDLSTAIPGSPPFPSDFTSNSLDLNLSDNYLAAHDLASSTWVVSTEWRTCIVKLQLQENLIGNLTWMKDHLFPNIQILNLSNNLIRDLEHLPAACPNLRHLQLSANPLPSSMEILYPLRELKYLNTLDCSACPVSTHPEYSMFILWHMTSVQILDGAPTLEWELSNSVDRAGGILNQDWLETKLRTYNDNNSGSTANLSLTNCGLQKIALSNAMLSRLTNLNLQHNALSTLTTLSSLASLRVLSLGNNNINALGGPPCPTCYSHTAQSQALTSQKLRHAKIMELKNQTPVCNLKLANSILKNVYNDQNHSFQPTVAKLDDGKKLLPPTPRSIFPKLEVMVLSHNGLAGLSDLHLHSMPLLHTVLLCCNNLSSLKGLENIPTLTALVLDNNHIREIPYNCLIGCKSLKYLHLEHNRLSSLPRLPHLTNLTGLYLAHNKLQSLTDIECLAKGSEVTECSLKGNMLSTRTDYRLNVATKLPHVNVLDGRDLGPDRAKLHELKKRLHASRPSPPTHLSHTRSSLVTSAPRVQSRYSSAKL